MFSNSVEEKEILIRGRILQLSAAIESTLAKIILYCQAEDPKDEAIKFKGLTLGRKIEKAELMMERHLPHYYSKYKHDFKNLLEFRDFRNRIAHCFITWEDENSLVVWDISEDAEKIQFYEAFKYTTHEILQKIEDSKKQLIPIIELSMKLENDFLQKYPGFFNLE